VKGTEAGHSTFAPGNELEWEFSKYYLEKMADEKKEGQYMETEKAFCGPSIPWIYKFLCEKNNKTAENLRSEEIFERGIREGEGECKETVEFFLRIYGRVTADLALITMPFGGLYLVGNMTVYLKDQIVKENSIFLQNFYSKDDQLNGILRKFPIYLVDRKGLGLYGATLKSQMDFYNSDDFYSNCYGKK